VDPTHPEHPEDPEALRRYLEHMLSLQHPECSEIRRMSSFSL
jgi:hypothetical protein